MIGLGEAVRSQCRGGHPCEDGWVCEAHPDQPFPHDECAGPGMPCSEASRLPENLVSFHEVFGDPKDFLESHGLQSEKYELQADPNRYGWLIVRKADG